MENASKAFLMAGGVLIAVLIIGLFVYMFTSMSGVFQTQSDIESTEEIEEYNKEYLSYDRKLLRGADIVSLCNKAINNNIKYEDINGRKMIVKFKMIEEFSYHKITDINGKTQISKKALYFDINKEYTMNNLDEIKADTEAFQDFKRRVFNCIEVKKNNEDGRIEGMTFQEQKINYDQGLNY